MQRLLPLLLLPLAPAFLTAAAAPKADKALATWHAAARALTPGATLEIPDGAYTTQGSIKLEGLHGTAEKPITIRAANRGKAVITGAAGFVLKDCHHLIMEGFLMTHDADQQGFILLDCQHTRVTRCTFRLIERARPRHWEHWVTIDGTTSHHNRIDHNLFENKKNRGSPVFVRGDDPALVCSQHDRVDHNHFRDQPYASKENGHETIRTGGNDLGASGRSSFTIIEHNLLERCSGEDEIISLKSSDNILRHNTLINCRGAICLRLGNRTTVAANFIIATEDGPAFGGIKLYGFEHRVFNNYCLGLTGKHHEAPFVLDPGSLDTPATENIRDKYDDMTSVAPTRCWIAHNTWIDCSPLLFGYKTDKQHPHTPADNTFIHNLVVRTGITPKEGGTPVPPGNSPAKRETAPAPAIDSRKKARPIPLISVEAMRGIHAAGNIAYEAPPSPAPAANYGDKSATKSDSNSPSNSSTEASTASPAKAEWAAWFQFADPHLHVEQAAGRPALWRLTRPLPASQPIAATEAPADAATTTALREDIFGQPRPGTTPPDVGAEQFTSAPLAPPADTTGLRHPLTPADVGPDAP